MDRNEAQHRGLEGEEVPLGAFAKDPLAESEQLLPQIFPICLQILVLVRLRPQQAMLTVQTSLLILLLL